MKVKEPKLSSNFSGPQTPSFSLSHSFRFNFFSSSGVLASGSCDRTVIHRARKLRGRSSDRFPSSKLAFPPSFLCLKIQEVHSTFLSPLQSRALQLAEMLLPPSTLQTLDSFLSLGFSLPSASRLPSSSLSGARKVSSTLPPLCLPIFDLS